ncbi:MAG TPA: potassium/proton antiporter [Planctomycetota bacterium]|nr:potassium/proton antiporter [Planctomycetota bacterium]HRR82151.1 potassium/proton antiporter [Planctomycetota bacterium]HRT97352.1 potassium/proton antiporter [Planctomycetota bacterium]
MDIAFIVTPLLLLFVVLAAVWLDRWSVPVIAVALGAGILFGSDVLGLWHFDDMVLTHHVANIALVFILFQGGFGTKRSDFKAVAWPAGGLATWGVLLTAAATLGTLWGLLGWPFERACLLAAITSSTDAAATFSILRRQSLPPKLASTIEIESAANDPMAVLLTVVAVQSFAHGQTQWLLVILTFVWKFSVGPLVGWVLGRGALWLFNRLRPQDRAHYYVLLLGVVLLTYGLAECAQASGMLAVFVCGCVMGNHPFVHRQGVANFSAALAAIVNIGMFLMMGLLVFPHQWSGVWLDGVVLFLVLALVARPIAVALGLLGMPFAWKKKVFIAWAGLRGAVPIVLATYPAAYGLPDSQDIFNLVFFAVLLSVLVQGSSLGIVGRALGLSAHARPKPPYRLELLAMAETDLDLVVVDLPGPLGIAGPLVRDLELPPDALVILVTRRERALSPRGHTQLEGGDQVTVLAHAADEETIRQALVAPFRPPADS